MDYILSCDWGTSSFRLRLVRVQSAGTVTARKSDQGIAAVFNSLDESQKANAEERLLFYLLIIKASIADIEKEEKISLEGVPLVISGMASSSIGMINLPYRDLPFSTDGKDIATAYFEASQDFPHPVLLISGVKSEVDVMRGEETQLIGAMPDGTTAEADGIYIFPGTHSKHIWVKERQATDFKTYMTGEIFRLLAEQSILMEGVEKNDDLQQPEAQHWFRQGVQDARGANLLHTAFKVRTNDLFGKLTRKANFHYLSGLLIGSELKDIKPSDNLPVYVCVGSNLQWSYETALEVLGMRGKAIVFPADWSDEAVVRGQLKIHKEFNRNI